MLMSIRQFCSNCSDKRHDLLLFAAVSAQRDPAVDKAKAMT